jgi:transcriptional regulator with XRE-family HTH domain
MIKRTKDADGEKLKSFIQKQAEEKHLSLRQVALATGTSPSYLSEVFGNKKKPSTKLLNALADTLEVSRVSIYKAAGLFDINEDQELHEQIFELAEKEPEFLDFLKFLASANSKARRRFLQTMCIWTTEE